MKPINNIREEDFPRGGYLLEFRDFGISFDSNVIFKGFEYELRPGIYAFIGHSGVGKTTLMRCIAGLENRYNGKILLDGKIISGTTPDVHMVHQHYTSFPWLNLVKNVLMVYKGHKVKITKECVDESKKMLTRFGLGEHFNKFPNQISGGQDQRLSLCSAFVNHWSKVVLYDEPSSALDFENTKILVELIKEHQAKYQTIEIVITHDQDLLELLNPVTINFSTEFRLGATLERTKNNEEKS